MIRMRTIKPSLLCCLLALSIFILLSEHVPAENNAGAPQGFPMYTPPKRGAPDSRMGGATRQFPASSKDCIPSRTAWTDPSQQSEAPTLMILLPDHTALTTKESPILYWTLSEPLEEPVDLRIIRAGKTSAIVETRIRPPVDGGLHCLNLQDYDAALELDHEYLWSVSIRKQSPQGTILLKVWGVIQRVPVPDSLPEKLEQATPMEKAEILAREGLWCDVLEALAGQDVNSLEGLQREYLEHLMDQVSLPALPTQQ